MAKSQRFALARVAELHSPADIVDQSRQIRLTALLQKTFQLRREVEVILDGVLVPPGDEDHVLDARRDALLDRILDQRLVHHRQHFLGNGLRRWKKSRSQTRHREDSLAHLLRFRRHVFWGCLATTGRAILPMLT